MPWLGASLSRTLRGMTASNTRKYVAWARENFGTIESFEKPFTFIDGKTIVRGKTDLLAVDKAGRKLLVDFKARTMKGIEETGVEDQLRVYRHCLKDEGVTRLATYTFFDAQSRDYEPDDAAAARFLAEVSAGLAAGSFPRRAWDKVCEKCWFRFLCDDAGEGTTDDTDEGGITRRLSS